MAITHDISPPSCLQKPSWDQKSRDYTVRKARLAPAGRGYLKKLTGYTRFLNFLGASRGPSVIGKAWQESGEHVAAAVLRAQHRSPDNIWQSHDVANSLMRQDIVRYRPEYLRGEYRAKDARRDKDSDKKPMPAKTSNHENKWALFFGKVAHGFHGICEMFAAPTSMTSNVFRNATSPHITETGGKNKIFMFGTLWGIGLGTTHLLKVCTDSAVSAGIAGGKLVAGLLIAFPAVSSLMGLLGTVSGAISQNLLKRPNLDEQQQKIIKVDVAELLHKLHHRINAIKDNPNGLYVVKKAMIGQGLGRKIEAEFINQDGVPHLLQSLLDVVKRQDLDKQGQLEEMEEVIGAYLNEGVDPVPEHPTSAQARTYTQQIEVREKHFRALCRLVNHSEIDDPAKEANEDLRRITEKKLGIDFFHNNMFLKGAALLCRATFTQKGKSWSKKLKHWTSDDYKAEREKKFASTENSRPNRFNPDYMMNRLHQYGAFTRVLLRTAEFVRLINMNVVLSSNAQLSRAFNNVAMFAQRMTTGGVVSRSMCSSLGRFGGGATLAAAMGVAVPVAANATGDPSAFDVGVPGHEITISFTNIGILMFLLSMPTLAFYGMAMGAAYLEGWKGDTQKALSKKVETGQALKW
ncbi:MAG TPA: hypothetical protein VFV39_08945 [Limnobacter sp.]|nr:hypothetical protein [Limnobacter sp.]